MKILLFLTMLFSLGACVSTQAPDSLKRAKKQADKHYQGLKNIVAKHPQIADSTRMVIRDTMVIEAVRQRSSKAVAVDTATVDSLLYEYAQLVAEYERVKKTRELEVVFNDPAYEYTIRELRGRLAQLRDGMVVTVADSLAGFTFEDDFVKFSRRLAGGRAVIDYEIKERHQEYDKAIISTGLDVAEEPSWFLKMIGALGWLFFILLILFCGYGIVKLYLKFKPL